MERNFYRTRSRPSRLWPVARYILPLHIFSFYLHKEFLSKRAFFSPKVSKRPVPITSYRYVKQNIIWAHIYLFFGLLWYFHACISSCFEAPGAPGLPSAPLAPGLPGFPCTPFFAVFPGFPLSPFRPWLQGVGGLKVFWKFREVKLPPTPLQWQWKTLQLQLSSENFSAVNFLFWHLQIE